SAATLRAGPDERHERLCSQPLGAQNVGGERQSEAGDGDECYGDSPGMLARLQLTSATSRITPRRRRRSRPEPSSCRCSGSSSPPIPENTFSRKASVSSATSSSAGAAVSSGSTHQEALGSTAGSPAGVSSAAVSGSTAVS